MNILIVVTNTARYEKDTVRTGLWLGELVHMYDAAEEAGHTITIASPRGGYVPLDPESLTPFAMDKLTKKYNASQVFLSKLEDTKTIADVADERFDMVYLAGGHGTMFDFPDNEALQTIIRSHYERRKIIAAVCHGVCGLLNVKLTNGEYLIKGKTMTGFSWFAERLAARKKLVPFNLEEELKNRGANYQKGFFPLASHVVSDENLITGQNPKSSKKIAEVALAQLNN